MKTYIMIFLLLSSGAASGGLEKVLRKVEFIADIYRQFPHSCSEHAVATAAMYCVKEISF